MHLVELAERLSLKEAIILLARIAVKQQVATGTAMLRDKNIPATDKPDIHESISTSSIVAEDTQVYLAEVDIVTQINDAVQDVAAEYVFKTPLSVMSSLFFT